MMWFAVLAGNSVYCRQCPSPSCSV